MNEISQIAWAKLAAYLDGEGCIAIQRGGNYPVIALSISNTDPRLPLWLKDTFGGTLRMETKTKHQNFDKYGWHITGPRVVKILESCMSHFIIKREEAEILIAFQKTKRYRGQGRWRAIPADVMQQRAELIGKLKVLKTTRPRIAEMPTSSKVA